MAATRGNWKGAARYETGWQRCPANGRRCVNIKGASSLTYTVSAQDAGAKLRIYVRAINGKKKTLVFSPMSTPVPGVSGGGTPPSTGGVAGDIKNTSLPTVTGKPTLGTPLTANVGTWSGNPATYTYQWQRCPATSTNCSPINGATQKAYTPGASDSGLRLEVTVIAKNSKGSASANSAITIAVSAAGSASSPVNSVLPSFSGVPVIGQIFSVILGSWSGNPTSYSYIWQHCQASGSACSPIPGATSANYTPVLADDGLTLKATVIARNASGQTSALTTLSAPVSAGAGGASPTNTVPPTISGATLIGGTMTASSGNWVGTGLTYSYSWQRCQGSCIATGILTPSYTISSSDAGNQLKVIVTAKNTAGAIGTASSGLTSVIIASPANTAPPVISGTTTVGQQLSVSQGAWTGSPTSYTYSWQRCNASGSGCANISGASASSYTLVVADSGGTIKASVTAINSGGQASTTSALTATIDPAPGAPGGGGGGSGGGGATASSLPLAITGPKSGGATYYVSPLGNDSSPGTLIAPWLTIQHALDTFAPGDKIYVRSGTYNEGLVFSRSGTAAATFNLLAYPGESPILAPAAGGFDPSFALQMTGAYERVSGFIIQGSVGNDSAAVYIWGSANHDEISSSEISSAADQGISLSATTSYIQVLANTIHNNGAGNPGQHDSNGILVQGTSQLIANNVIYGQGFGSGIALSPSGSGSTVVNNTIAGNSLAGIALGGVSGIIIRNNIITNNGTYAIDKIGTAVSSFADHNLFYANTSGNYPASFAAGLNVSGGNTVADPSYIDYATKDLSLGPFSPALNISSAAYTPLTDRVGGSRPLGAGPDLGAFER
jgi:parallel beta-helix repeat protein